MYIGKTPIVGNFQKCDAITVVNGQAAYTLQVSSTNVVPESANHMLVSLNGILQKNGGTSPSFTVSGSTLTFASNLATGDVIDFVILLGNVLDLGTPSDGTVTNAKLAQDIISGETALASTPADTDEFLVSDAGTLKRIDYSLIKPGWTLIKTVTASSSSAVTFVHGTSDVTFDSTYKQYCIIGQSIVTATDNVGLLITTTNDGSSYETSYKIAEGRTYSSGTQNAGSTSQTASSIGGLGEFGNASGENGAIIIWIPSPSTAGTFHTIYGQAVCSDDVANCRANYFGGQHQTAEAYTGIKFAMSSGNIASGTFSLYGVAT